MKDNNKRQPLPITNGGVATQMTRSELWWEYCWYSLSKLAEGIKKVQLSEPKPKTMYELINRLRRQQ